MFSWRINFWYVNFPGTLPLDWHYTLIHTRKTFFLVGYTLKGIPLSPGADAFLRVDNIRKKSSKEKQFVENEFRSGVLSGKPSKSAS